MTRWANHPNHHRRKSPVKMSPSTIILPGQTLAPPERPLDPLPAFYTGLSHSSAEASATSKTTSSDVFPCLHSKMASTDLFITSTGTFFAANVEVERSDSAIIISRELNVPWYSTCTNATPGLSSGAETGKTIDATTAAANYIEAFSSLNACVIAEGTDAGTIGAGATSRTDARAISGAVNSIVLVGTTIDANACVTSRGTGTVGNPTGATSSSNACAIVSEKVADPIPTDPDFCASLRFAAADACATARGTDTGPTASGATSNADARAIAGGVAGQVPVGADPCAIAVCYLPESDSTWTSQAVGQSRQSIAAESLIGDRLSQ